ncbi:RdlA protein [Streptomyces sp. NPDC047079]|uniref:RdlA protein n=1 Tax=Streptomyces sp. NPDC047079 TaxID=3154607 RepID=UPI0033E898B3
MLKQAMAMAAVVAAVAGATVAAAPPALASGDDGRTMSAASTTGPAPLGDPVTGDGTDSRPSLAQTSLNRLRAGLPTKTDTGSVVGSVPFATQAAPLLPDGLAGTG